MGLPDIFNLSLKTSWCFMRQYMIVFCWILAVPGAALSILIFGILHKFGWLTQPEAAEFILDSILWIIPLSGFLVGLLATNQLVKVSESSKLRIVCGDEHPWIHGMHATHDPYTGMAMEGIMYTCRIGVINSGPSTIRNISVRLIGISPGSMRSIPCHLHFMNDNVRPYKESKDLPQTVKPNYKDALFVDVFQFWQFDIRTKRLLISSTVEGVQEMFLEPVPCTAEISVSSENGGETVTTSIEFIPTDEGPPQICSRG